MMIPFKNIFKRQIKTKLLSATDPSDSGVFTAAEILKREGLVAIPTETVYGLAANALSALAVAKIFKAKGRPQDNPLIVHISSLKMLYPLVLEVPEGAKPLMERFWPGPLTLIFRSSGLIPKEISAGLKTIAIRMPAHPIARAVIEVSGLPLAAPSANLSGGPSPTTAAHCMADLNGRIDAVLDGGPCDIGVESTVLDLTGEYPVVLRPGGITVEEIRSLLPETRLSPAVSGQLPAEQAAPSPGMKYKHYAPKTRMILLEGSSPAYTDYVNRNARPGVMALCLSEDVPRLAVPFIAYGREGDPGEQARSLFEKLRELDEAGAELAYVRSPRRDGLSLAVYNRLLRACAFDTIRLEESPEAK